MPQQDLQRYFLPLVREHIEVTSESRVLELGYYDPAGALVMAAMGARVVALRPAIDLATEVERLAREQGLRTLDARLDDSIRRDEHGTFDVALVLAPFFLGNAPVKSAIRTAVTALRPDGALFIQLHRRHGGATFLRFVQDLFDEVELLGMGGGQRRLYVAHGLKAEATSVIPASNADDGPSGAKSSAPLVELAARGRTIKLQLTAGVFGARRVDPGSTLLVKSVELLAGSRILDLGCGAGTIGLALAAADSRVHVTLVDSSRAAVELARQNAALNALTNVNLEVSDGYGSLEGERFDVMVSNLPAHRGHQIDVTAAERFIAQAPFHLRENGAFWFVTNKAISHELPASRAFREVRIAATDPHYKVIYCRGPQSGSR
jgi:16S rRNA (guanine1207-N2)-methyltransferase